MQCMFVLIVVLSIIFVSHSISVGLPHFSRGIAGLRKVNLLQNSNILIRGGKKKSAKAVRRVKAEEKEPDLPINDDALDEDNEDSDESEEESSSNKVITNLMSKLQLQSFIKTPPMTQMFVGSSVVITVLSYLLNNNKWPEILSFSWKGILMKLQVWRFFTSFLSFGPMDLFFPFNLVYVWQHMSQLEKLNCKKPEEFFMLLMFGSLSLVTIYTLLGMPMTFLGHNLASYLVYIWSRAYEGQDVNFMEILTLKAEMVPWFFCLQTLVMERAIPWPDMIGIAVGHLYFYLNQKKLIVTPAVVSQWFATGTIKRRYDEIRQDFL